MNTLFFDALKEPGETFLNRVAHILKKGGLVAVPTETVYGLAVIGTDAGAVAEIYRVKGRPPEKPISLLVGGTDAFRLCEDVPESAYMLAEKFWPGPLTIVLKRTSLVPDIVAAGGPTVGLRCPRHPVTLGIIRAAGAPLAAPSANLSGEASPKNAADVMDVLGGRIDAVVDGGQCDLGIESTIVDLTGPVPRLLRQGGLSADDIKDVIGELDSIDAFQ